MIRLAGLAEVDAIWPKIAGGMEECCRRSGSDITPDWLFFACRKGEALLALVEDGEGEIEAALIAAPQVWGGRRVNAKRSVGTDKGIWRRRASQQRSRLERWSTASGRFAKPMSSGRSSAVMTLPRCRRQAPAMDPGGSGA